MKYDVIIVGAGPAGLSAALLLGRSRRSVLICAGGKARNASARALHGFLTRDGIPPGDLLAIARSQLEAYGAVTIRDVQAKAISGSIGSFEVLLSNGAKATCARIVIATGVMDALPRIEGIAELYGRSVYHCPYCDGWEVRDEPLAAYGQGDQGVGLALELRNWSSDVVLLTDGGVPMPRRHKDQLAGSGIEVLEDKIVSLEGSDGSLSNVVFKKGDRLPRKALFLSMRTYARSPLAEMLGCGISETGVIETEPNGETSVPGVYAAGDATDGTQLAIVAASEGARVAIAINKQIMSESSSRLRVLD